MKIVAKTNNGYLAEISDSEVKAIMSKNDSRKGKTLSIGDELTLASALERLTLIKELNLNESYKTLGRLRAAREELEAALNIVEGLNQPLILIRKQLSENSEA